MRTAVAAGMLVAAAPAWATDFHPVAGAADNTTVDGVCTLREAVNASNEVVPAPDCGTGSGTDVIVLSAGTYDLSGAAGDDANASGDLDVLADVVFNGAGADATTINAHQLDRILDTYGGINATLSGLKLTGGKAPNGTNGTTGAGGDGEAGGAIRAGGDLTLDGVSVTFNSAGDGGTGGTNGGSGFQGGNGGRGGGMEVTGALTITNSIVSNNTAGRGGTGGASGPGGGDQAGGGGQGGIGGGIRTIGSLSMTSSVVTGNHAGNGGPGGSSAAGTPGTGGNGAFGGGIHAGAATTIRGSTLSGNSAGSGGASGPENNSNVAGGGFAGGGGGLVTSGAGDVKISDSQITGNSAGNAGTGSRHVQTAARGGNAGGVWLLFGTTTIERTTVSGNKAGDGAVGALDGGKGGDGGGIFQGPLVDLTLTDSTVSGNSSGRGGDADQYRPGPGGDGGGIYFGLSSNHSFTGTNVTVTGNTTGAGGDAPLDPGTEGAHGGLGGGVYMFGPATLRHFTVAGNTTGAGGAGDVPGQRGLGGGVRSGEGTQTIINSILASNTPSNCNAGAATIADGGHNVSFGDTTCPGVNGDPLLQALAGNGGPTQTVALGEGSSAIDLVPADANCAAADQRGTPRPQRAACDAGAYEATPPPPPAAADQQQPGGNPSPSPDKTPPVVKLLLTKQKLLKALKRGYFAFFSDNETGSATADLFASGKTAKGTAARRKRVAHGTLKVTKTGKQKLVLKFTKKAKKAFKRRKRVTLQLVLTVKDAAGNTTRKSAKVTLKR